MIQFCTTSTRMQHPVLTALERCHLPGLFLYVFFSFVEKDSTRTTSWCNLQFTPSPLTAYPGPLLQSDR